MVFIYSLIIIARDRILRKCIKYFTSYINNMLKQMPRIVCLIKKKNVKRRIRSIRRLKNGDKTLPSIELYTKH